jgi:hypothetical protein
MPRAPAHDTITQSGPARADRQPLTQSQVWPDVSALACIGRMSLTPGYFLRFVSSLL